MQPNLPPIRHPQLRRSYKHSLTDTDLGDPQAAARVQSQFTETLRTAETHLNEAYAQATERADTVYAGGEATGAVPTKSAVRLLLTQPLARYETAINYYRTVSQYLDSSLPVRNRVAQTSRRIQDLPTADPQPTTESFSTMESQLDQLKQATTTLQHEAPQDVLDLLPDVNRILQQAETQLEFYTVYARCQKTYLDARDAIVQGTTHYEQEAYTDARSKFKSVSTGAAINTPDAIRSYAPTQDTASLNRLGDVLQSLRRACTKMRAASRSGRAPDAFSEGRSELIDAEHMLRTAGGTQ